ncbi:MAG: UDP-N-acetylmuramate:L-alanyl-gamma-D-glutamyl-meso-diaminopimelate ligase [Deltaproteobacteria bacterium]|nr:UDP-N-acetylmuramate:L-alanyl-gamma-D-glutamyl-meso-diaminopimelate ligase [Deltaproteobacteria bacterium]
MGICGTGMASLAGMLKHKGYHVTGSDQNVYPPMSLFLEKLSIPVISGYRAENLSTAPDLVIVGNVITRLNIEAVELSRLKLPYLSFPQALKHFAFKTKRSVVISGTHGKTTTSSLAAWVLEKAGMDPGFMIGGIPLNFQSNFKLGKGDCFVIEGDEYDTAFFDKGPKFLHYNPWVTVLTSIEFDHADIYRDLDHVIENFRKLIRLVPQDGLLIANSDDPVVMAEIKGATCPVITYGFSDKARFTAVDVIVDEDSTRLTVLKDGGKYLSVSTPLYGNHNISNLLSVIAMADFLGIPAEPLADAAATFEGIKRRQELIGEKQGVIILDDFAHHPTAVRETVEAVKEKYKGRRLIAVFEPRSNSSRRNIFQNQYVSSFEAADLIMIPEPPMMEKIPPEERFSSKRLTEDLEKKGKPAFYFSDTNELLEAMVSESRTNDIFLIMSNGGFDDIHRRLLERL